MVAFHFPPLSGSSGIQRTLGFARHLPEQGWTPVVLSPQSRAYESVDQKQLKLIPEGLAVERSFCLDSARHLSIKGRYPDRIAIPDRWVSWIPGAVLKGRQAISKYRPTVIWSTYPIATTHIVGRLLSRRSNLPWVADFRDPMVEWDADNDTFVPSDPALLQSRLNVERRCAEAASALVFCTDKAKEICLERYPTLDPAKCHVISNGYDEWSFVQAEKHVSANAEKPVPGVVQLLHSGTIYPTADRDPSPFFNAIQKLKISGAVSASNLNIKFRASGHDGYLTGLLDERDISDIVELAPSLPYTSALSEMLEVDGLLVFQGHTSNPAIPAKIYEYLRARKPILALLDSAGSTVELMGRLKVGTVAPITEADAIQVAMNEFLDQIRGNRGGILNAEQIQSFSRSELTRQLSALFDSLAQPP